MTLADRIADVLQELGPLPGCVIAPTVRKQKAEVLAVLHGNPTRFVLTGKARASRWSVREDANMEGTTFTVDDLAKLAECDDAVAKTLVFGSEGFLERGYLERVDGNGRLRVTDRGLVVSRFLNGAKP